MQKIVINTDHGGFWLSSKATERYQELSGMEIDEFGLVDHVPVKRDDPYLVQTVEELKEEAEFWTSQLKVVQIPDLVIWDIEENEGKETIVERHRKWN